MIKKSLAMFFVLLFSVVAIGAVLASDSVPTKKFTIQYSENEKYIVAYPAVVPDNFVNGSWAALVAPMPITDYVGALIVGDVDNDANAATIFMDIEGNLVALMLILGEKEYSFICVDPTDGDQKWVKANDDALMYKVESHVPPQKL